MEVKIQGISVNVVGEINEDRVREGFCRAAGSAYAMGDGYSTRRCLEVQHNSRVANASIPPIQQYNNGPNRFNGWLVVDAETWE
jgi:hypothetical protein